MAQKEEEKSLYERSSAEIFWKNFLVGFSRGLGSMITSIAMLVIAYYAFFTYVMPKIMPFLNTFQKAQESIERIQTPTMMLDGLFEEQSSPSRNSR